MKKEAVDLADFVDMPSNEKSKNDEFVKGYHKILADFLNGIRKGKHGQFTTKIGVDHVDVKLKDLETGKKKAITVMINDLDGMQLIYSIQSEMMNDMVKGVPGEVDEEHIRSVLGDFVSDDEFDTPTTDEDYTEKANDCIKWAVSVLTVAFGADNVPDMSKLCISLAVLGAIKKSVEKSGKEHVTINMDQFEKFMKLIEETIKPMLEDSKADIECKSDDKVKNDWDLTIATF